MSPRFYSFLWMVFAVAAGVLWLGNVFTMMTAVVLGFIAFGLIFTGMMCVLPSMAHYEKAPKVESTDPKAEPVARQTSLIPTHLHAPMKLRIH